MLALNPSTTAATEEQTTQPYFLVMLGFDTPVRLCSRDDLSWGGYAWTSAEFELRLANQPELEVFNEIAELGQVVLTEKTAGRAVQVYHGYGNDTRHPNPRLILSGEMGKARIVQGGRIVSIPIRRSAPLKTPRQFCVPPYFNHLPVPGTRFETPNGVVILEE